jgi:hypothetical protein
VQGECIEQDRVDGMTPGDHLPERPRQIQRGCRCRKGAQEEHQNQARPMHEAASFPREHRKDTAVGKQYDGENISL